MVRQEYSEISRYFVEVIKFRFVVIGLFLTAVGALLSQERSWEAYVFGMIVVFALIVLEIRNRIIYWQLAYRGMAIERDFLIDDKLVSLPFYMTMFRSQAFVQYPDILIASVQRQSDELAARIDAEKLRFLWWRIPARIKEWVPPSHSFAIDVMFLVALLLMLIALLEKLIN